MEVIKANDGLLTNIEVLQVLEQRRESRGEGKARKGKGTKDKEPIIAEVRVAVYIISLSSCLIPFHCQ